MTEIANAYAQALYSLAEDEHKEQIFLQELSVLQQSFAAEPDFIRLLSNPALPKQERCRIIDSSFRGKVMPYVLNFLKILTEKGYIHHFSACCDAFRHSYNQAHNILPVTATTALPLTPSQQQRLSDKLAASTGKTIELSNRIDVAVLGGVRLDYDGMRLDDTVRHRLDAIGNLLKNSVL